MWYVIIERTIRRSRGRIRDRGRILGIGDREGEVGEGSENEM